MRILLLLIILLFPSCSVELWQDVTVTVPEIHPFESVSGNSLWYELRYFNGESIIEETLEPGTREFSIRVKSGGLRPIVLVPLGKLSPIGGFYEPGDRKVSLYSDRGNLASILVDASGYRPDVVSRFSYRWLCLDGKDSSTLDQRLFLEHLFAGTLSYSNLKNSPLFSPLIEGIPSGYWISDSDRVSSFTIADTGDSYAFRLFAGVYNFWNQKREMLLTLIITEEGECFSSMSKLSSNW